MVINMRDLIPDVFFFLVAMGTLLLIASASITFINVLSEDTIQSDRINCDQTPHTTICDGDRNIPKYCPNCGYKLQLFSSTCLSRNISQHQSITFINIRGE